MKQFVFGTEEQFRSLDILLADGMCHIFKNCKLPGNSVPKEIRIGFEKESGKYRVLVDMGITSDIKNEAFKQLISTGERSFLNLRDLIFFFHSLKSAYTENSRPNEVHPVSPVIDIEKLKKLREEEENKVRYVSPDKIAEPIKKEIFGQDMAIDGLAHEVSAYNLGKTTRPLVLAFLGPPATGKTQTGRLLSENLSGLYNRNYGFIEIAGSEYLEEHMVCKILGSPPGYTGHGGKTALQSVRDNPYHIILINEIEKAHEKLLIALMEAFETGFLGMADNSDPINLRNCIIILTSNLPVDMDKYNSLGRFQKTELCREVFTCHCGKPEITRRITDFLVYMPLTEEARIKILIKFIKQELSNFDATLYKIDEQLMVSFLTFQTNYGASELGNFIRKAISYKILDEGNIDTVRNKQIILRGTKDDIKIDILEVNS